MSLSPMLWLACRERWQSSLIWLVTILIILVAVTLWLLARAYGISSEVWKFWRYLGGVFTLLIYLGTASQASRFFLDARRNGLIELLLAAPLNGIEFVRGQWRALVRMFAAPVVIYLCIHLAATALSQRAGTMSMLGAVPTIAQEISVAAASTLVIAANLLALGWFGMWMGMTSKGANVATLKTLVFVQLIPWLVIWFVSWTGIGLAMMPLAIKSGGSKSFISWFPMLFTIVPLALSLVKDIFFVMLARRKLYSDFRALAVKALVPVQVAVPPPLSRPAAPPLLPARPS